MALSRLVDAKPRFHLHRIGPPRPTRWFSSISNDQNENSSYSKKSSTTKEQRAVAVESYVKKFMESHPEVFPKPTHVQNKVGGSWYTVKDILSNLKEKMLGNPQIQNDTNGHTSNSAPLVDITSHNGLDKSELGKPNNTVRDSQCCKNNIPTRALSNIWETSSEDVISATDSEITRTHSNQDNAELPGPESIVQSPHASSDCNSKEQNISHKTSCITGEGYSVDMVNTTESEVFKMHNYPDSTELAESTSTVQFSDYGADLHSTEKDILMSAVSRIFGRTYSEDMVQPDDVSGSLKLVEPTEALPSERDQKSSIEQLSFLKDHRSEPTGTVQDVANKLVSSGYENHQPESKMRISSIRSSVGLEVGETPASFGVTQKVMGFADIFTRITNDQTAGEVTNKKTDILTSSRISDSNKTTGEDMETTSEIKGLLDYIKGLPREQSIAQPQENIFSSKTNKVRDRDLIKGIQSQADLQKLNSKGKQNSLNGQIEGKESEEETGVEPPFKILHMDSKCEDDGVNDADVATFDCRKSKTPQIPLPTTQKRKIETSYAFDARKGTDQNKVLVRFLLNTAEESDLASTFRDCGDIMKIEFSHVKGSFYKAAYIYFKTRKGLQKAIQKTNLKVNNAHVLVEAASSLDTMPNRISIPNLIGDPDVPDELVKNPTRTVMIKQLTHGINSHHIEEALTFCQSNITGFYMGSSSSVAYVEFETEDAKEKALAKNSIVVLGKQLLILRIDSPRTTVVRISMLKIGSIAKKVLSICETYGQVRTSLVRHKDNLDVHFRITEWPNMINILNRLNGTLVDGQRLVAQPAPVFPPEVLRILWSQPDERRRMKTVIHSLLQKLGGNVTLTDLVVKFYGGEFQMN